MMITNPDVEAVWKFSEGHGLHVTCRWLAAYRRIRLSLLVADSRRYERVGGPCVAQKVRDVAGGAIDVVVCFHLSLSCATSSARPLFSALSSSVERGIFHSNFPQLFLAR